MGGHLSSEKSTNLTLLANLALLSLSRNAICGIQEGSLHSLTKLRTLSLGHNHIPSSSLSDHTFSKLRSLQVLVLSSNALRTLRAAWFRNTKALNRLLLGGNQTTNLTGVPSKAQTFTDSDIWTYPTISFPSLRRMPSIPAPTAGSGPF